MSVVVRARLTGGELAQVRALVAATTAADQRSPLSEETLLHLADPERDHGVRHVLGQLDGQIAGYGMLIPNKGQQAGIAEIAVDPAARSGRLGQDIIEQLLGLAGEPGLSLWAHGRTAYAASLVQGMGFQRKRTLLQLRRVLTRDLPEPHWPDGFDVRTYQPARDEGAVLEVNKAAFAALPDQGGWTGADLSARLREPWFDPAGFFLVESADGQLAGFHWTKMHLPEPLGEIYVLAVAPTFAGRGLATPLIVCGLRHLRAAGARTAMLYVDAANRPAVRRYDRLGFAEWDVDVLYVRDR